MLIGEADNPLAVHRWRGTGQNDKAAVWSARYGTEGAFDFGRVPHRMLTKPGGIVVLQDVDISTWRCEPPHPAWERLFSAFVKTYRRDGKDPFVGRKLPALLRQAALNEVQVDAHARVNGPGDFHQTQLLTFVQLFWSQIAEECGLTHAELMHHYAELEAHLQAPTTMVVSPLLFQAWGSR